MNVEDLIYDSPKLFRTSNGEPISYGIADELIYFIDKIVNEKSNTLETGAGISTILFGIKGTNHTCIVPEQYLIDNIKDYCLKHKISIQKINFIKGRSQDLLCDLELNDIDVALIDGDHAFPIPFIDWYYIQQKIKVDGIVIVDDVQLWTGEVLKDFLLNEPEWKIIKSFSLDEDRGLRSVVFSKKKEVLSKGWGAQLYVVRNSKEVPDFILKNHGLPTNYRPHSELEDMRINLEETTNKLVEVEAYLKTLKKPLWKKAFEKINKKWI